MLLKNCVLANVDFERIFIEGSSIEIPDDEYNIVQEQAAIIINYRYKPEKPPIEEYLQLTDRLVCLDSNNELISQIKELLGDPQTRAMWLDGISASAMKNWYTIDAIQAPDVFSCFIEFIRQTDLFGALVPLVWLTCVTSQNNLIIRVGEATLDVGEYLSTIINFLVKNSIANSYTPRNHLDQAYLKAFNFKNIYKVSPRHRALMIENAAANPQARINLLNQIMSQNTAVNKKLKPSLGDVSKMTSQYTIWCFLIQNVQNLYPKDTNRIRFVLHVMLQLGASEADANEIANKLLAFSELKCIVPQSTTVQFVNELMESNKKLLSKLKRK